MMAKSIVDENAQSNLEMAKIIYDFILDYMTYDKSGEGWGRGDFWYACKYKKGNCTDFHSFFIGFARSLKIPSFFEKRKRSPCNKIHTTCQGNF